MAVEIVMKEKSVLKLDESSVGKFRGLLTKYIISTTKTSYQNVYILFENINLNNILLTEFRIDNLTDMLFDQILLISNNKSISKNSLKNFIIDILDFKY